MLTQGFWRSHPDAWPSGFTLEIDGESYDRGELIALMNIENGDISLTLLRQLVAALLNGGLGADCIADTIEDALEWMRENSDGALPYGIAGGSAAHQAASALADALSQFNQGNECVERCIDGPVLQTLVR